MNNKRKLLMLAAGLLTAAAAVYYYMVFPKILLKRTFAEMKLAFEQEDVNRLMDYFSTDYRDGSNLLRADVSDVLVFFFEDRENIRCDVERTKFLVNGKKALVQVWGVIHFETRGGAAQIDLRGDPLILQFAREKTGWRVVEVANGEAMVE